MRWPVMLNPTPGTITRSIMSIGIGLPVIGSRTPWPVVVMSCLERRNFNR